MEKLITLEEWAKLHYSDPVPCMNTLRAWARKALIFPAPVKHGKSYRLAPEAKYQIPSNDIIPENGIEISDKKLDLLKRLKNHLKENNVSTKSTKEKRSS